MKLLRVALALLLVVNVGSIFITNAPIDPALFGQKPFHAQAIFEINGEASDPSRWTSQWVSNHPEVQQNPITEVELKINHSLRGTDLARVEILADTQEDADAVLSLVENDFSQAYRPSGQFQQPIGRQHEETYANSGYFWRQCFELLLIANVLAIFGILIISIFCARKPTSPKHPVNAA